MFVLGQVLLVRSSTVESILDGFRRTVLTCPRYYSEAILVEYPPEWIESKIDDLIAGIDLEYAQAKLRLKQLGVYPPPAELGEIRQSARKKGEAWYRSLPNIMNKIEGSQLVPKHSPEKSTVGTPVRQSGRDVLNQFDESLSKSEAEINAAFVQAVETLVSAPRSPERTVKYIKELVSLRRNTR